MSNHNQPTDTSTDGKPPYVVHFTDGETATYDLISWHDSGWISGDLPQADGSTLIETFPPHRVEVVHRVVK